MSSILINAGPNLRGKVIAILCILFFTPGGCYKLYFAETNYDVFLGVSGLIFGIGSFCYILFYKLHVTELGIEKHMFITHTIEFKDVHRIDLDDRHMLLCAKRTTMLIPWEQDKWEDLIRITLDKTRTNSNLKIIATEKVRQKYGLD